MSVKARLARLERLQAQHDPAQAVLLVIGEPTPEHQAMLDHGQYRVALFLPDNGRDPRGTDEPSNSQTP